jgi:hypothetical protein
LTDASDLTGNSVALTLLDGPNAAPTPLPFKAKPLPQMVEHEITSRVQQMLAPPSHGRRKIWDFDGNLHYSIIGTCLTNAELQQVMILTRVTGLIRAQKHKKAEGIKGRFDKR